MTWLAPWSAIVGAAIALPVLIAIYMLKLRRRPMRVSVASLWAEAAEDLEANVPLRWLRPSWLLLLQALALAALIAALGRPALETDGPAPDRLLILIDTSASMRVPARDARAAPGQTRFDLAREQALRLVDRVGTGAGPGAATVIAVGPEPRALTPLTPVRGELRRALETLRPTDAPADLPAALRLASALAASGEEDAGDSARAVLLSDGGFDPAAPLAAGLPIEFVAIDAPVGDADTEDAAPARTDNTGIVALAARRDYTDPALVRVLVNIAHAGERERSLVLRLTLDGREVDRRALTLPAPAPDEPLSERAVALDVRTVAGGLLEASINPGGRLDADDRAATLLSPADAPSILWLVPSDERDDADDPRTWVLGDVLEALDPRVLRRAAPPALASDPALLAETDALILDRAVPGEREAQAAARVPSLRFLAPPEGADPAPTRVVTWDREHPILRDAPLDALVVRRPAALPPLAPDAERTILARGREGPLIAEDATTGARHILVAFDPLETDWPLQPGFPVFIAATIDYLTLRAERDVGLHFRAGQPVRLPRRAGAAPVVLAPDGEEITPALEPDAVAFRADRAGVYTVRDALGERAAPANLTDRVETAAIARSALEIGGVSVSAGGASAGPVELWRWLVLIAAVLFLCEWFVYALRARG